MTNTLEKDIEKVGPYPRLRPQVATIEMIEIEEVYQMREVLVKNRLQNLIIVEKINTIDGHLKIVMRKSQIANIMTEPVAVQKTSTKVKEVQKAQTVMNIARKRNQVNLAKSPANTGKITHQNTHLPEIVTILLTVIAMRKNTKRKRKGAKNKDPDLSF